ncbi:hypothetical protein JAAARDRAFT_541724 [Jaapia argillacea MUCL 33604]|uniref:HNH nuclease domain-containing protein n=1 Tax=Jaapia argillacea MUCL 33604 TaxID=933084 RepID=A0A067PB58_9AGAM|nr:hypothetical protein JAAARDRAFT_541724 [Jaapia argillacea MUCL 33604]
MSSTPLPPNPFDGAEKAAYDRCLHLESLPGGIEAGGRSPQLYGRVLGYMMLHAPTPEGRHNVGVEIQTRISASDTPDSLSSLAQFYMDHFIRVFKAAKDRTPAVSSTHSSRPAFDLTAQEKHTLLRDAPRDHRAAKKLCLVRDNYRCVITGRYDVTTIASKKKEDRTFVAPGIVGFTTLVYITAESANSDIKEGGSRCNYPASAWSVLERFGKIDVKDDQLNGEGVYRLPNVMTMCFDPRAYFDRLELWLQEVGTNRYRVYATDPDYLTSLGIDPSNSEIQLTTTDPDLALPDPRLLRLHAACAKVAHFSGAGKIVDETLRDIEELEVLAYDGGSAHVLIAALLNSRIQVGVHN